MDKESDFIFEAYQKIYEAPVGAGGAYDDDVKFSPERVKQLSGSTYGKISEEDVYAVVRNIKDFLEDHEGSTYPGSMTDFKLEIKVIIQSTLDSVNATKAGYAARVITNELKILDVIDEVGEMVRVKDVDKVDEIGDELEDTLGTDEEKSRQFMLNAEYDINRDIPMSASDEAKEAHDELMSAGMAFGKHKGTDIIKATGILYTAAKGRKQGY